MDESKELKAVLDEARDAINSGAPADQVNQRIAQITNGSFRSIRDLENATRAGPGGLALAAAQGLTFGFGDELVGIFSEQGKEAYRRRLGQARQASPMLTMGAEIAGALPTGVLGAGRALAGRAAGGAASRLATSGAAQGALAGVGEADGGLRERTVGGAIGGTIGAGTQLAVGGARALSNVFRPQQRAQNILASRFEYEGIDPRQAVVGAPEGSMLLDVGGPSTADLARTVQARPGPGASRINEALMSRNEARAGEIADNLTRRTGLSPENMPLTFENLVAQRKAAAKPLYDAAYQRTIPLEEIYDDLALPRFRQAYEAGRRIAALDVDRAGRPTLPELPDIRALRAQGVTPEVLRQQRASGAMEFDIPIEGIDYMKQGVDDLIRPRVGGASTVGRREGQKLAERLENVLQRVDAVVPEYRIARNTYAGDSSVLNLLEEGGKSFREAIDPRQVALDLQKLSPENREFFRRGMIDEIRRTMARTPDGRNPVSAIYNNQQKRQTLQNLFDDPVAFRNFDEYMRGQQQQAATEQFIMGGSPTARIQQSVQEFQEQAGLGVLGPFASAVNLTHYASIPRQLAQRASSRVQGGITRSAQAQTGGVLADMLTQPTAAPEAMSFLEEIERRRRRQGATRALTGAVGGRIGGSTVGGLMQDR